MHKFLSILIFLFPFASAADLVKTSGGTISGFTVAGPVSPPTQYTLTVTVDSGTGTGSVSSSPSGISCASDCTEDYNEDTVVTLTAAPSGGDTFDGWADNGCAGTGTCQVTMDQVRTVVAAFTADPGGDPYDLSGFSIPFVNDFNWPTEPTTTAPPINVTANDSTGFFNAISTPNTLVTVPAGTYTGVPNVASNVDIVMDDNATVVLTGNWSWQNSIWRWTGGVIAAGGYDMNGLANDVMFDNVKIDNVNVILPGFGSPLSRYAMINCTVDAFGYSFFSQGALDKDYTDMIMAGNDLRATGNLAIIRMMNLTRGIAVDNRIQSASHHSLRAHYESDDIFWGNNTMQGGTLTNVCNHGDCSTAWADLGNIYVIGNTTYNASSQQSGFNRSQSNPGDGPQIWQDNVAYVVDIGARSTDQSRFPTPLNVGDVTSGNYRDPYGSGPPTDWTDWSTDYTNGADH